ncbi:coiled-coil domain-containing protein 12-like [Zophobas morio]|uniref:coiled-coil domain-containing protein 12-like n=1 Tax=Zophobas morio TaxID=2755281 RepID=UPI003083A3CA
MAPSEEGLEKLLKFKNYSPRDPTLASLKLMNPCQMQVELTEIRKNDNNDESILNKDIDLGSLAPRKITWDLERDLAKKFRRLERKTGKAIAELVKERLQGERSDDIVYVCSMCQQIVLILYRKFCWLLAGMRACT